MRRKEQDVTCNSLARKENERERESGRKKVEEKKRKEDGLAPTGVNEGGFLLTFISFFPPFFQKIRKEKEGNRSVKRKRKFLTTLCFVIEAVFSLPSSLGKKNELKREIGRKK